MVFQESLTQTIRKRGAEVAGEGQELAVFTNGIDTPDVSEGKRVVATVEEAIEFCGEYSRKYPSRQRHAQSPTSWQRY